MKHLLSLIFAVLVAITAFGQSSPPNKLRSNDSFTQVDNYLVAAKRLGIPSGPTPTLNGSTTPENSSKLFYATDDNTLYVYDPVGEEWNPVSSDVDLSNYWTIAQVDSAIMANIAFNVEDVTQILYTDKAINVMAFNNTGMTYSEGSIDFGITRDSTHTMGLYAFKQGRETTASGDYSSAFGRNTTASGNFSSAFGQQTTASGGAASAFGNRTTASGAYSSSFGSQTTASGQYSSALGSGTTASGHSSSAFGAQTIASGWSSSAFGNRTTASGDYSSAFGQYSTANEYASLAIGRFSTDGAVETSWTPGSAIFKVGNGTGTGTRSNAYVLYNDGTSTQYGVASYGGDYSASYTDRSLVDKAYVDSKSSPFNIIDVTQVLYQDKAISVIPFNNTGMTYSEGSIDFGVTRDSVHTMGPYAFKQGVESTASGIASSAFGYYTTASSNFSSAFGQQTTASGGAASAFGYQTTASATYSSAFGFGTTASGTASSAFGNETMASALYSSAFGSGTTASGNYSSAFGSETTASGIASLAFGDQTIANEYASLAIGRYSTGGAAEILWTTGSPVFKVGNGTSSGNRSNAYVLYNDGRSEQVKDIEITEIGQGVVIKSPDGTRWRITVDNSGNLTTTSL